MIRAQDRGMVLLTVLAAMALCTVLVLAMAERTQRQIGTLGPVEATARLSALILAAEEQVLAALQAVGAQADLDQLAANLTDAQVSVALADAQALFNLNTLALSGQGADVALRLMRAAGLSDDLAGRVVRDVAQGGALLSLTDLAARSGLTPEQTASLGDFINVLPLSTAVNLNTASTEVLSAFLADASTVERFAALRARRNRLTWSDLDGMGLILPAVAGLDSTVFAAEIRVRVGTMRRRSRLLVIQSPDSQGQPSAQVLRRWLD